MIKVQGQKNSLNFDAAMAEISEYLRTSARMLTHAVHIDEVRRGEPFNGKIIEDPGYRELLELQDLAAEGALERRTARIEFRFVDMEHSSHAYVSLTNWGDLKLTVGATETLRLDAKAAAQRLLDGQPRALKS